MPNHCYYLAISFTNYLYLYSYIYSLAMHLRYSSAPLVYYHRPTVRTTSSFSCVFTTSPHARFCVGNSYRHFLASMFAKKFLNPVTRVSYTRESSLPTVTLPTATLPLILANYRNCQCSLTEMKVGLALTSLL